jgi:hypothetical protein
MESQFQQVAFLLDKDRLESTLKDMSDSCVLAIEPLCVDSIEELHPARQVGFRRFDKHVVMVAHKAVPMTDPAVSNDNITENLYESSPVIIIEEDVFSRPLR